MTRDNFDLVMMHKIHPTGNHDCSGIGETAESSTVIGRDRTRLSSHWLELDCYIHRIAKSAFLCHKDTAKSFDDRGGSLWHNRVGISNTWDLASPSVWSTLIGRAPTLLHPHWSRASLVMLAPAILCHKEPARASKAPY